MPIKYILRDLISFQLFATGYEVASIARDLDWIAVMTYDYHGQWDKITGHVAPMYPHPEDKDETFNAVSVEFSLCF